MKTTLIIFIIVALPTSILAQERKLIEVRHSFLEFGSFLGVSHQIAGSKGDISVRSGATIDFGVQFHARLRAQSKIIFSLRNSNNSYDSTSLKKSLDNYYGQETSYRYNNVSENSRTWTNFQMTLAYSRKVYSEKIEIDAFLGTSFISISRLPTFQRFERNELTPSDIRITHTKEFPGENSFFGPLIGTQFSKRITDATKIFIQSEFAYRFGEDDVEVTTNSSFGFSYKQNIEMGIVGFKYGFTIGLLLTPFNRIYEDEK